MKRIFAIILSIAVTVSFMPAFSFAAETGHEGFPPGVTVKAKSAHVFANLKHQDSELENIRQQVLEILDDSYAECIYDQKYYADAVYAEIVKIYKDEYDRVRKAKKLDELVQPGLFGYTVTDSTMEAITMLEYLGGLTVQNGVKGSDALAKCVEEIEQYKSEVFAQYKLSKYNNWYQDIINEFKADINAEMKKLKASPSFAGCATLRMMISRYDTVIYDDDEDWIIIIDDEDDEDGGDYYFDEEKLVYTKDEIIQNIDMMHSSLTSYIESVMADYAEANNLKETSSKYKKMSTKLTDYVEKFPAKAKKIPDIETIYKLYNDSMWEMYEMAGLAEEEDDSMVAPSNGDILRLKKAIEELYMSYDLTKYSDKQRMVFEELYEGYMYGEADELMYTKAEAETMETRAAARAKFVSKVKKKFDKIPVKTVELKNDRTKYYNKLVKKYKTNGKKKYNQKKVKNLLAKAKAEMNKATEPEDIEEIYQTYLTKLNNTINKYTVKTIKKGKGTITKTKKVKYGKNFTVKFTPKAGYKIKSITVDGKKLKKLKNKYTFKKVKKTHKIKVVFGK